MQVVGQDRYPSLDDRNELHYTNAVIQESFRAAGIAWLGVPHYATQDVTIGEYVIPKDTTVMGCLYHTMNDPSVFKDPQTFNPDR